MILSWSQHKTQIEINYDRIVNIDNITQEIYSKYNYHKKCLESERRIAIGTEIVKSGRKIDAQSQS